MAEGIQHTMPSGGGPRFRIVPGPILGENSRANAPRSMSMTPASSNMSTPSYAPPPNQIKPEDMDNRTIQMQLGSNGAPKSMNYVMMNQGNVLQNQQTAIINSNIVRPTVVDAAEQASMVAKCARFFKTLIHLSKQPDQHRGHNTAARVTELVKLVIFGSMPPEVFTSRLQEALRSQAQPHLLPFLQKTLPALRAALQKGEVMIEGITLQTQQVQQPVQMMLQHSMPLPDVQQQQQQQSSPQWEVQRANNENAYALQRGTTIRPAQTSADSKVTEPSASEESITSSSLVETDVTVSDTEVRSYPSSQSTNRILNGEWIARKIQRAMPDCGVPTDELVTMISHAAEYRLRVMLTKLAIVAEHRVEPLRNHPFYQQMDDVRRQLRFVEEFERVEHERRENREKEALIKLSKTKGKDKETLIEKAKQLQKADQEAARNRDANAAAIAALGGSRINKRPWTEANNPFDQPASSGVSAQTHRPRTKRVTMRDLQFVLSQDRFLRNSSLLRRLVLFNYASEALQP